VTSASLRLAAVAADGRGVTQIRSLEGHSEATSPTIAAVVAVARRDLPREERMNANQDPRSLIVPGVVGFLVFAALQSFLSMTWDRLFAWSQVSQAWWLNSGPAAALTLSAAFLATSIVLASRRIPLVSGALAMGCGLGLGMAVALLLVGPGNLWPIVLGMGWALLGAAVLLGSLVAAVLRRVARPREA
jgi:hypothetical protein